MCNYFELTQRKRKVHRAESLQTQTIIVYFYNARMMNDKWVNKLQRVVRLIQLWLTINIQFGQTDRKKLN